MALLRGLHQLDQAHLREIRLAEVLMGAGQLLLDRENGAECIQASSRVGRVASMPGLVVTLNNCARPRDLAHFAAALAARRG